MPRPPNPELPNLLMDAALSLLDEREDVLFSMRELAGRINYSVTAVYRCYETRGDLLRKLTVKLFGMMAADVVVPGPGTVEEQIGGLGERFLAWSMKYPGRFRLMFLYAEPDARLTEADAVHARGGLKFVETVVASGNERGQCRVAEPSALATILFSSLVGLASLALAERLDGVGPDTIAAYYAEHRDTWLKPLLGIA